MGIVHVACVAAARKCVSAVEVIRGTPAGRARVTDDAANCKNNSRRDAVISQASASQLRHKHHGPGYATPQLAREQPPEQFAYVAALHEGTGIDPRLHRLGDRLRVVNRWRRVERRRQVGDPEDAEGLVAQLALRPQISVVSSARCLIATMPCSLVQPTRSRSPLGASRSTCGPPAGTSP